MIIKNKKTLFPNDRDPRGNSDFDRFTTYPNQGKISDNKPITFEHDSQQRNYPPKSEEKKEKKTKEIRRFVHFFTAQISLFHSTRGLRGEKKKNETRAKLDNRGTQHGGDSPQRRAGTVLDDAGTDGCVASLTRGRAIVCGLVLPIRQRLSTPKALSLSLCVSVDTSTPRT